MLRHVQDTRSRTGTRGEVVTWLDVLKFIGLVLWTIVRICLIIFLALVLGGFRGAAQSKSGGTKVT